MLQDGTNTYDNAGNLNSVTYPSGVSTNMEYSYDATDRLTSITYSGFFSETLTYALDAVGNGTNPDVWKPLAGAGIIIVADLPVLIGEPLCVLTIWTGFTCVAVQWYAVFVATPATYVGLCMIGESNFFSIPGLDSICGQPNTAHAAGLSNRAGPGKE